MPVNRRTVSLSMFSELLGLTPALFLGVEYDRRTSTVTLVLEPEETCADSQDVTEPITKRNHRAPVVKGSAGR